ncbi:unnamed protein product [Chondrus crispus]|uniref:Uncharacterized protein n=1 Tax=Chondrus crispus TaxID=2769 RepID=R7QUD1_CHOCR|nr:unnamed protein product [Chondrus crispus]CDF41081.1 unnamed protein product [Chondrus crispus]|eukprot:XP_005711375.1 unnamed protein product [Chondrus crispus]
MATFAPTVIEFIENCIKITVHIAYDKKLYLHPGRTRTRTARRNPGRTRGRFWKEFRRNKGERVTGAAGKKGGRRRLGRPSPRNGTLPKTASPISLTTDHESGTKKADSEDCDRGGTEIAFAMALYSGSIEILGFFQFLNLPLFFSSFPFSTSVGNCNVRILQFSHVGDRFAVQEDLKTSGTTQMYLVITPRIW